MARSSDAVFPLSLLRDRTFQIRQIRRVFWLVLFVILQSTLLLGLFYHNLLGDLVAGTAPLLFAAEDLAMLDQQIPQLSTVVLKWLLAMLLINALVMAGVALFILRKLGNPLLAMRRALEEIGQGNLAVRLRKEDTQEFSELCSALDSALDRIQQKIEEARAETRVLTLLDQQPPPQAETVQQALLNCHNVLAWFNSDALLDREDDRDAANSGQL